MCIMASRTLNRRALREPHDEAEADDQEQDNETGDAEEAPEKPVKKPRARKATAKPKAAKDPAKPRVRKKKVKEQPRMFARWAVCDNAMKRVAVFEYKDRAGADAKLLELRERKSGTFFLQMVKDPYTPPATESAAV
jgi:hypothetical protein